MTGQNSNNMQAGKGSVKGFVNCIKCEYFFVTWDPKMPRGCKLFGFKGREVPSVAVFTTTGSKCPSFKEKKTKA